MINTKLKISDLYQSKSYGFFPGTRNDNKRINLFTAEEIETLNAIIPKLRSKVWHNLNWIHSSAKNGTVFTLQDNTDTEAKRLLDIIKQKPQNTSGGPYTYLVKYNSFALTNEKASYILGMPFMNFKGNGSAVSAIENGLKAAEQRMEQLLRAEESEEQKPQIKLLTPPPSIPS